MKKLNGPDWLHEGKVDSLDDFLFPTGKVSKEVQGKYPVDFEKPISDSFVEMQLSKGKVVIRLFGNDAPIHVQNFINLTKKII